MGEIEENSGSERGIIRETGIYSFYTGDSVTDPSPENLVDLGNRVSKIMNAEPSEFLTDVYPAFYLKSLALVGKIPYVNANGKKEPDFGHKLLMNVFRYSVEVENRRDMLEYLPWADEAESKGKAFVIAEAPVKAILIPALGNDLSLQKEELFRCFSALIVTDGVNFDILTAKDPNIKKSCGIKISLWENSPSQ